MKRKKIENYYFKLLVMVVLTIFILVPTSTIVNATSKDEMSKIEYDIATIKKYFITDNAGVVLYVRDLAIEDGISNDLLSLADEVYAYGISQSSDSEKIVIKACPESIKTVNAKVVAFPVYGNWCGPGYGSGTPIDLLDQGCKNHDMCYSSRGYHKCSCDRTFLNYVKSNYGKMTGASQKNMARVIQAWLTIKTSNVTNEGGNFSCRI